MLLFTQADGKVTLGGGGEGKVDSNRLYFILPKTGKKIILIIHFVSELKWLLSFLFFF